MTLYLQLFYEFFVAGLFSIGGGMATIPFLYKISDATNWFTYDDLANMIAVSESTPGPIGVNMATYVGYVTGLNEFGVLGGILGSVTATLGLITPSIIIILIIAAFLKNFKDKPIVKKAFYGLRPASTGLIAAAGITVILTCLFGTKTFSGIRLENFNLIGLILAVVIWIFTNKVKKTKGLHPIIFIGISALVGILFSMV